MNEYWLPVLFFFIALFYSSVGFGGGSSYLALLSLVLVDFHEIRSTALALNLVVVSIGTMLFIRNKVFKWRYFWPFIISSVPLSFFGAQLKLSEKNFFLVLGGLLITASCFMITQSLSLKQSEKTLPLLKKLSLGSSLGLLSGISGIGGGIFLSPTLNLIGWKDTRVVASLASVFIFFNSIGGLGGLIMADTFQFNIERLLPLMVAVGLGGALGGFVTNKKFNIQIIRLLTAILIAYVGLKLILLNGWGIHI